MESNMLTVSNASDIYTIIKDNNKKYVSLINQQEKKKIGQFVISINVANFMVERIVENYDFSKKDRVNILRFWFSNWDFRYFTS